MITLEEVQYNLPNSDKIFISHFLTYLSTAGLATTDRVVLRTSSDSFFPKTNFFFTNTDTPQARFIFSGNSSLNIDITNSTNISKKSPHKYSTLLIEDFVKRVASFKLKKIDHTGFNLPFFDGIHPKILELRKKIKSLCLYHTFPKHLEDAPWDFILPATKEEIHEALKVDYSIERRPKIEIVSFDKSSTPLIQIDIQLDGRYEDWLNIFPEAIDVSEMKSLWVYIQNDFGIDICFVLNEVQESDWSFEFAKDRLL